MAKPKPQPARASPGSVSGLARRASPEDRPPGRAPGGSSAFTQLVAEVEALKAELAAARARLVELERQGDVDPLLDILNRRGFERALKRSLAYVERYGAAAALLYLDLDHFKPINDRYGHAAGDAVLKAAAAALVRNVRASDLVGRLGGDELAVLLWNVTPALAAAKAEALEQVVGGADVVWNGVQLVAGVSAGTTMLQPLDEPAAVLERADRAMYARKAARRLR